MGGLTEDRPAPRVAVARSKFARGFDGSGRGVPAAYEVVDVREALERVYTSDAHLVTYTVRGATKQPRINKPGLACFEGIVETNVFFCDVDNAGHGEWTDELFASAMRQYETAPILATAGVYHTAHGRRIVQPIAEPIVVQEVEPYLKRWLLDLDAAGFPVDWACRDWTRHFRPPHVRRGGRDYRSPYVALDRMAAIALAPIADVEPVVPNATRPRRGPTPPLLPWTRDVPASWTSRVETIAQAVRHAEGNWHEMFLAIAGALLARRVPHEHIPALCRAISIACGCDDRTEDRERGARSTVDRHRLGAPAAGYSTLRRKWPGVADALDAALATGAEARVRALAHASPAVATCSLEQTTVALRDAIRTASDGATLIKAQCGLGKTAAIRFVAKERAEKEHATAAATGARAPHGSKTSISVDKNALAIQVMRDLRAEGASVKRLFGPLSVLREDGTPECRFHLTARPLVSGGQSIRREFCQGRGQQKCEFYEECRARDGVDGPPNARIAVGPHALLSELDGAAGATGLLVIDEPPALLETETLTVADFDGALAALPSFVGSYGDAMRPALLALRAWTANVAPLGGARSPTDALAATASQVGAAELGLARRAARVGFDVEGAEAVVACARGAIPDDQRGTAPPILRHHVFAARRVLSVANELGAASRVLRAVHAAVVAEAPVAVRVEERGDARVLLLTQVREDVVAAIKREGSCILADANIEVHAPVLAKLLGYEPFLHTFSVGDGAPIERTLHLTSTATRRAWLPGGKLGAEGGIVSAVSAVIAWAVEDPAARDLGIITFLPAALAIRAALAPSDATIPRAWLRAGQDAAVLARMHEVLGPMLAKWPGRIVVGHYGGVRGLDDMKGFDALATLGDPWPNLGEIQHELAFLGLEGSWEARAELLCRAELEQAHGRLRTVHRSKPGRALHVGRVLPGGPGWNGDGVVIRVDRGGRPRNEEAMTNNELVPIVARLGGVRAAARSVGCHPATISRYVNREMVVPRDVGERLRAMVRPRLERVSLEADAVPANDGEAGVGVAETSI